MTHKFAPRYTLIVSLILLISGLISGVVSADPIPADRQIDWSQAGIPGGIPDVAIGTNVLDHGAIPDDGNDDAFAFQAAINAVKGTADNGVMIPAGTYNINSKLEINDSVVLRGASPTETHLLLNTNGVSIEIVTYDRGEWVDVVADVAKGETMVTVADGSSFTVGTFFEIQQENSAVMLTDSAWDVSWGANAVGQIGVVTAVNGNQLTVREPFNTDFTLDYAPQIRTQGFVTYVGVENLHLDKSADSNPDGQTIFWKNGAYTWVDRVHSEYADKMHVSAQTTYACEVRDSLFEYAHDYGGSGHGYGVEFGFHVTGCRVENNIFDTLRHAMIVAKGANGNVYGYNASFNPRSESPDVWSPPDISLHGHAPYANLFEGNTAYEAGLDKVWGPAGENNTLLRNCVQSEGLWWEGEAHQQNIVGNTITDVDGNYLGKRVNETAVVNDVIVHGNFVAADGAVQWDDNIADQTIPTSYYLDETPAFYGGMAYPSIGGDLGAACTNPAYERYVADQPFAEPAGVQVTLTPTSTPAPTSTSTSTSTPEPTSTSTSTSTPTPISTSTPTPTTQSPLGISLHHAQSGGQMFHLLLMGVMGVFLIGVLFLMIRDR